MGLPLRQHQPHAMEARVQPLRAVGPQSHLPLKDEPLTPGGPPWGASHKSAW